MRTLIIAILLAAACGGSDDPAKPDAAGPAPDAPAAACFENPTTHAEIINACTKAQKVEKQPVLPLLNSDGTLPPLPP